MIIDITYNESATRHKKRIEILHSAYRLFIENGIKDVSMQMIADASGIQHRTLYTYYNDKELIATDIMKCSYNVIDRVDWNDHATRDTYEKLSFFLNRIYDYIISDPEVLIFTSYFNSFYSQSNTDYLELSDSYHKIKNMLDWQETNAKDHSINAIFATDLVRNYYLLVSTLHSYATAEALRQVRFNLSPPDFSAVREFKDLQLSLIKA